MTWKASIAVVAIAGLCCIKAPPAWYARQDRGVKMPDFHDPAPDYVLDGAELQAIRIATDDFLPAAGSTKDCAFTEIAHLYKVIRRGDVIFVRISTNPDACGGQGYALDGTGSYAISVDGRILRRILDTEPDDVEGEDAGGPVEVIELPTRPDGGMPVPEVGLNLNEAYLPRWFVDGGIRNGAPAAGTRSP